MTETSCGDSVGVGVVVVLPGLANLGELRPGVGVGLVSCSIRPVESGPKLVQILQRRCLLLPSASGWTLNGRRKGAMNGPV